MKHRLYRRKRLPHSRRGLHLAFKLLRTIPKFSCDVDNTATATVPSLPTNDDQCDDSDDDDDLTSFDTPTQPSSSVVVPIKEAQQTNDATPSRKRNNEDRGGFPGRKKAKAEALAGR